MKSAGALLLDLSSSSLSSKLQRILETAFTITLSPRLSNSGGAALDEELGQTIRRADAGLMFLISAQQAFADARHVLAALKRIVPEVPVIVALEECDSAQVFDLLNAGAADFISAPFQEIDVLPRAWKALKNFLGEDIPAQLM